MTNAAYSFRIVAEDPATAARATQALADTLREARGVLEVDRKKVDDATMELGTIVTAIATSGATLAIAQGIAAWLRARKGASLNIERHSDVDSIKVAVAGIDSGAAVRIAEIVRG